jgi:predicted Holliday junction resolvase-like endonuclease
MIRKQLVSTIFSCLLFILVLVNILLAYGNQSLQSEVAERQQTIAQAFQLEALYRQVITVVAEIAMKTNDPQLKELLKASGFAVGPQPEPGKSSK